MTAPTGKETRDRIEQFARLGPVDLRSDQVDALAQFVVNLSQWNAIFHFSAYAQPNELLEYLIFPSLALSILLTDSGTLADLGSGPGIPGFVIALAKPGLDVICIDSRAAPMEFIAISAASMKLSNVRACQGRGEFLAHDAAYRESFDAAIARSFAPMPVVVEIASALVRMGSPIIMQSSALASSRLADHASELLKIGCAFDRVGAIDVPSPDIEPVYFAAFRKLAATPPPYPRSWNTIKRNPLWV